MEVLSRKIYNQLVIQKTNLRNVFTMYSEPEDPEIMTLEMRRWPTYSISVKQDFQNKKKQRI